MTDQNHLIQQLTESRARMKAALAEIEQNQQIYPPWKLKNFIDHLTGWDECSAEALLAHAAGKEPATPAIRGIDPYNESSVATRAELDFRLSYGEWELAREEFIAAIRAMPDDRLNVPMLYPWAKMGTVAGIVQVMYEHELEHAAEIEGLKKEWAEGKPGA